MRGEKRFTGVWEDGEKRHRWWVCRLVVWVTCAQVFLERGCGALSRLGGHARAKEACVGQGWQRRNS